MEIEEAKVRAGGRRVRRPGEPRCVWKKQEVEAEAEAEVEAEVGYAPGYPPVRGVLWLADCFCVSHL